MYRDGDGTSFRSGKLNEFVKTLDFQWVPHQARGPWAALSLFTFDCQPFRMLYSGPKIPYKVEAGDLVLIHDMVWHKSLPNNSNRSRNIFTWHLHNSGKVQTGFLADKMPSSNVHTVD